MCAGVEFEKPRELQLVVHTSRLGSLKRHGRHLSVATSRGEIEGVSRSLSTTRVRVVSAKAIFAGKSKKTLATKQLSDVPRCGNPRG